jgi:hypothetical protein
MRLPSIFIASVCLALLGCNGGGEVPAERPSKTFTIFPGDTVTYESAVARVGDYIVCVVRGERSGATVGKPGTGVASFGTGPGGSTDVSVSTKQDGSVVASCKVW